MLLVSFKLFYSEKNRFIVQLKLVQVGEKPPLSKLIEGILFREKNNN